MLDSIYHMPLKLLKNHIFGAITSRFCHLLHKIITNVIGSGLSILLQGVISFPDVMWCDNIHKTTDYTGAVMLPICQCTWADVGM